MLFFFARGGDAHGIALIALGQRRDRARHCGRKHQGAAVGRCGVEDGFQFFAKAQIKHFIGFVQHHGLQAGCVKRATLDVIAQSPRCADNDVGAAFQRPAFGSHVHAADARGDFGPGHFVQPIQFALDLQGQFPGRGDDQRQGHRRVAETIFTTQQRRGQRQAERYGLARPGLGRNQGIGIAQFGGQHGLLHRCQNGIAPFAQRLDERRNDAFEFSHVVLSEYDFRAPANKRLADQWIYRACCTCCRRPRKEATDNK